jgi:hypothetical protein
MTPSPATCWNAGRFIGVIIRGRRTGQTVDETILSRRRANKSQPSRCDIFPTGRVVSVLWGLVAWQGSKWSLARPEARGGGVGRWERGREEKEARELLEKRRGTSASLYLAKDWTGR